MRKLILAFVGMIYLLPVGAASVCGDGYVLTTHSDIDGIPASQCKKLWCRDLEIGGTMGAGDSPAAGYVTTRGPIELCVDNDCVMCFGDRNWCNGEVAGVWNPEYGAYTRGGADSAAYRSYKRGNCFAWRLQGSKCPDGQIGILKDGEWVCATSTGGGTTGVMKSSTRRPATMRRINF